MTRILSVLIAAALISAPAAAQTSRDASFGEWPFLVGNMDGSIPAMVAAAKDNGLDTIYINAFRATGLLTGQLWITDSARTWNAAWGAVRPSGTGINLVNLISAEKAQNIQVVAVIKCFETNAPPTNAAHRQYLLDVIDYLVNSYDAAGRPVYDLDGISLDYVRFVSGTGNSPTSVTNFVRDVKTRIGALSLHAYLVAGRYTFDGPTYDLNFNSYTSVINSNSSQYGQHWEQMARWVDVMMPMAYTADGSIYNTYAEHQAYVRTVAQYTRMACQRGGFASRRVVPAIRCYSDTSETATAQTIDASITGALLGNGDGYHAFRYGTMLGHNDWWTVMKAHAVPGQNKPVAVHTDTLAGLSTTVDATACRDADEPAAGLQVRFDWENDGVFDTPYSTTKLLTWIARNPGNWRIGLEVKDTDGLVGATTRLLRVPAVLSADRANLSASAGGIVRVSLGTGPATSGMLYVLAGSLSGTSPGTPLAPGFTLPLNVDALTLLLLQNANTPLFSNSIGTLDGGGAATAAFTAAPGLLSPILGQRIDWAGVGANLTGSFAFVTNPVALTIDP